MKDKNNLNFIINALLTLSLALTAGIGVLLKYFREIYKATAHGAGLNITFLGMNRYRWGKIHFILSIIFIILLLIHIILHWKWIATTYKDMIKSKAVRTVIGIIFIITTLLAFLFPFIIKHETTNWTTKGSHSKVSGRGCIKCHPSIIDNNIKE
ncbi:MAG: DUF4405 domain-containing protein [Armatimonadota bacterium]